MICEVKTTLKFDTFNAIETYCIASKFVLTNKNIMFGDN